MDTISARFEIQLSFVRLKDLYLAGFNTTNNMS